MMKDYYGGLDSAHQREDGTFYVSSNSCGCCAEIDNYDTAEELIKLIDEEIKDLTEFRNSLIKGVPG